MKLDLELTKDVQGNHFLMVKLSVLGGEDLVSYIPLQNDPLYVLYKKITSEFHHFDIGINQAGLDFKAKQAEEAANGSTEQAEASEESLPATEKH